MGKVSRLLAVENIMRENGSTGRFKSFNYEILFLTLLDL